MNTPLEDAPRRRNERITKIGLLMEAAVTINSRPKSLSTGKPTLQGIDAIVRDEIRPPLVKSCRDGEEWRHATQALRASRRAATCGGHCRDSIAAICTALHRSFIVDLASKAEIAHCVRTDRPPKPSCNLKAWWTHRSARCGNDARPVRTDRIRRPTFGEHQDYRIVQEIRA